MVMFEPDISEPLDTTSKIIITVIMHELHVTLSHEFGVLCLYIPCLKAERPNSTIKTVTIAYPHFVLRNLVFHILWKMFRT